MMENENVKILVVDDTEATRYAIARTLRASGYRTVEAANGSDALRLIAEERPDLVTLDIHLPDMLGFEVCRRIKADAASTHIPVLQVSASFISSKHRIHGLEGGADSYLTHPFEPAVLLATVKSLLRGRQLFEELRLSEEKFRVALTNAPIMIYTCDRDLKYTWIHNTPAPLQPDDFLGKFDADVFSAADAVKLQALKSEALESGIARHGFIQLTIAGSLHSFDITLEPYLNTAGGIKGLTVACIDVTERVKAQEAQRLATEEAELANRAKTRFLSNMSHEIRTPLGIIQGFTDIALTPEAGPDEVREYLQTIKRNAYNLMKLLGEILDLSKVESGRLDIEKTRFSISKLISELVDNMSLQAREKGVGLSCRFDGDFPDFVVSDPTRIRQILMNLISNAVKFTAKGEVNVVGRCVPGRRPGKSVVEFEVHDTGIGVALEQRDRLFQAFSQADSSTTRRFGGTGLGLNLSKKLAEALGGALSLVSSKPGEGSCFKFAFDAGTLTANDFKALLREPAHERQAGIRRISNQLSGLKVLLVEDTVDNQLLFAKFLRIAGAAVDFACDGREGIELAQSREYDVILMDLQMPNLDGHEATAYLRASGLRTPIVALTAHALKEERDRALSRGFTGYLIKPLDPVTLIQTLSPFNPSRKPSQPGSGFSATGSRPVPVS